MAQENTEELKTELKETSERLFALLNKQNLSAEDKQQADAIIAANPQILSWKDFTAKISLPDLMSEYEKNKNVANLLEQSGQSLQAARQVLDNLQQMKKEGMLAATDNPAADVIDKGFAPNGETLATQAFKNINFLDTLKRDSSISEQERENIANHTGKDYKVFLHQMYEGENSYGANPDRQNLQGQKAKDILKNIMADRQPVENVKKNSEQNTLTVEGKKENTMPQNTLSIENLRDRAYQGTLTVEQAEELRKHDDDKKVADMKSQPGDAKKNKREPSNDKFKDEDVIRYMYEDWFLGGASWLFNKAEAYILDTIDSACDLSAARAQKYRRKKEEQKEEKLKTTHTRADNFLEMTGNMMNGLGAECQAKIESYNSLMQELRDNLGNPNPNWQHFSPEDPFIKKLEANPSQAQKFIKTTSQELENRTKMIETTGKLAMLIASTQMTDEFMKHPSKWNIKGKPMTDEQLRTAFIEKYQETQRNILKALSVMAEDNRLTSEAVHNTLPDPKPDLQTFTQERLTEQQNEFLKKLSEQAKTAVAAQRKELDENHFDSDVSSQVAKTLGKINKEINSKIQDGNLYNKEMFKDEHSKERIGAKAGLYEEAMKENSPQSMQKIFEYTKELNGYQLETMESRRINAATRKATVDKYKNEIAKRNQNPLTSMFGNFGKGQSGRG